MLAILFLDKEFFFSSNYLFVKQEESFATEILANCRKESKV